MGMRTCRGLTGEDKAHEDDGACALEGELYRGAIDFDGQCHDKEKGDGQLRQREATGCAGLREWGGVQALWRQQHWVCKTIKAFFRIDDTNTCNSAWLSGNGSRATDWEATCGMSVKSQKPVSCGTFSCRLPTYPNKSRNGSTMNHTDRSNGDSTRYAVFTSR